MQCPADRKHGPYFVKCVRPLHKEQLSMLEVIEERVKRGGESGKPDMLAERRGMPKLSPCLPYLCLHTCLPITAQPMLSDDHRPSTLEP